MWFVFAIPVSVLPVQAAAQEANRPRNVNDCTFLTDPTRLRQCIQRFEAGHALGRPSDEEPTATGSVEPQPKGRRSRSGSDDLR